MQTNVIAFDRTRKPAANRVIAAAKAHDAAAKGKVIKIADWKTRVRTRRTASGVFFTTGVLLTYGNVA